MTEDGLIPTRARQLASYSGRNSGSVKIVALTSSVASVRGEEDSTASRHALCVLGLSPYPAATVQHGHAARRGRNHAGAAERVPAAHVRLSRAMTLASAVGYCGLAAALVTVLTHCGGDAASAPAAGRTLLVVLPVERLEVGQTTRAGTYVVDSKGSREEVVVRDWSVSSSVLAVSSAGEITAVGIGTARVVASWNGLRGETQLVVDPVRVARVDVAPAIDAMSIGGTTRFSVALFDEGGRSLAPRAVEWTTSDSTVARVAGDGTVTALAAGPVAIRARCEGEEGSVSLYVRDPMRSVTTIAISPPSVELVAGDSVQLNATLRDTAGRVLGDRAVVWLVSSSGSGAASIRSDGLLTALAPGTLRIEAISEGRRSSANLSVRDNTDPGIQVKIALPDSGVVSGDSLRIIVDVDHPDAPLKSVVAYLGDLSNPLQLTAVGNGALVWAVFMDVRTIGFGTRELVVYATDTRGHLGIGRRRFTREIRRNDGGPTLGPRSK